MISLRYEEREQYDPLNDEQVVQMMAISATGTWHTRAALGVGESLRARRQMFMDYVSQAAMRGMAPCEVKF